MSAEIAESGKMKLKFFGNDFAETAIPPNFKLNPNANTSTRLPLLGHGLYNNMAEEKDKPVPQKRNTSTKAKQTPSKASRKSQEFVQDSDDEDVPAQTAEAKESVSYPAPVAVSAPAHTGKKEEHAVKAASESAPHSRGDESGSEDPSEDEFRTPDAVEEVSAPVNGASSDVNGVKRTRSEASSSSEESEGDSVEEQEEQEPAAKRTKTGTVTARRRSEADTRVEAVDRGPPDAPASKKPAATQKNTSGPLPPTPWEAPSGYTAIDLATAPRSKFFASTSLEGKQIWHISAPSDIPLASISEVAIDAISSGKPVLKYKGFDYVLTESGSDSARAYASAPGTESFTPVENSVVRTLQLQQQIILPELSDQQASQITGSAAAASIAQASVNTIRQQPKGLRMRFRPPGHGEGESGMIGSDSESGERDERPGAVETFQFPRALGAHGTFEQQDWSVEHEPNGPAQKHKRKRKEKSKDPPAESPLTNGHTNGTDAVAPARPQQRATETPAEAPAKSHSTPEKVDEDVAMPDVAIPPKPSKEDKARRKEEKRARKDVKAKSRAL
ncbi:hypothetical protein LTR91_006376 [Friedmanniomyces endolithicus]|uniref:DNA-directed RNA polymerase I subunit RPA34.5 n=1 Tax=Friedmanniomyces endolithicus TaxID=329885 RepID=A0AAN6FKD5_9PEZI|nr:hypothetical protein LTR35_002129 [Friedmanniomyces endolithicus]KAK0299827.1 hypothetical protein LTS00_001597 [Friedmanniomyces endolithicus]KAK0319306.1 hypothetical protein LTR82_009723 [Friedmanniomyces endolithicus]KAK0965728.1 hypothetical protein LTS01_018180 [Friedmanniomyces endolithicus]KAK0998236.1 hypothetical protein LTR91_006376 [Friedmanniomyces endolithicus]